MIFVVPVLLSVQEIALRLEKHQLRFLILSVLIVTSVYISALLRFWRVMLQNQYDGVVVGGGPAGSMAAWEAAKGGASVCMLEKTRDIGYPVR